MPNNHLIPVLPMPVLPSAPSSLPESQYATRDYVMQWYNRLSTRVDELVALGLPPATTSTIGGVIVGDGLGVDATGLLSLNREAVSGIAQEKVAEIVADAPETFDTLKEIADWITKDETGTQALLTEVGRKVSYVLDKNNGYSAVTLGTRSSGSGVGLHSLTVGQNNEVSGDYSMAIGTNNRCSGSRSFAAGSEVVCYSRTSFALGVRSVARNAWSFVWSGVDESEKYYDPRVAGAFCINPVGGISGFYIGDQNLKGMLDGKVDKATGKGLSTNDYTTAEKNKLSGIEAGAQKNPDLKSYVQKTDLEGFATEADLLAFYYPDGNVTSMSQITTSGINYAVGSDGGAYVTSGERLSGNVVLPWKVTIGGREYKVTKVGDDSFSGYYYDNNFTSFTAPITVKSIGESVFTYCESLTSVSLPSVRDIGGSAFFGCNLLTICLPSAISIRPGAFESCFSLTSINIPSATSIQDYAFFSCTSLTSINIPSVTSIGGFALTDCYSLSMVNFGSFPRETIPTLGEDAFAGVPRTCKFIIPLGMYDEWIATSGWSDLYAYGCKFEGYASVEQAKSFASVKLHTLAPEGSDTSVTLKPVDGAANWLEEPIDTTAAGTVRSFNLTINWSMDVEFWDESMEDYNWEGLDLKPLVLSSDTPGLTFTGVVYERDPETGSHIYYLTFKLDEGHDLPIYLSSEGVYGEVEVGHIKQYMLDDGTFYIKIERYDSPLPEGLLSFNGSHNLEEFFDDDYFDYNYICSSFLGARDICFGCVPLPDVISEHVSVYSIHSDMEVGGGSALTVQIPASSGSSTNARFFSLTLTSAATDEADVTWQGGEVIEAFPGASNLVPGFNVWDVAEVAPGKFKVERVSNPAQSVPLTLTAPNGRVAELTVNDDLVLEVKEVE